MSKRQEAPKYKGTNNPNTPVQSGNWGSGIKNKVKVLANWKGRNGCGPQRGLQGGFQKAALKGADSRLCLVSLV